MMPVARSLESVRCHCGGAVKPAAPAGSIKRVKCLSCGGEFPQPPLGPGPCPKCSSTSTIPMGGGSHCNDCSANF
jgi:hypothetical protein